VGVAFGKTGVLRRIETGIHTREDGKLTSGWDG
jgi:hypothetical protein